jgi:hypothetical protein
VHRNWRRLGANGVMHERIPEEKAFKALKDLENDEKTTETYIASWEIENVLSKSSHAHL